MYQDFSRCPCQEDTPGSWGGEHIPSEGWGCSAQHTPPHSPLAFCGWGNGVQGPAPPGTQARLWGAPGLFSSDNRGVSLVPQCSEAPGSWQLLPCHAVPCRATPRVRFPSARHDRGNIYTVARAHLIFMGTLFIDGSSWHRHPKGAPSLGTSPLPPKFVGFLILRELTTAARSPPHWSWRWRWRWQDYQLRSFATEGSGGDYKIFH